MSHLVVFDQKGALGPATTLLFNINDINPRGIDALSCYVKEQFAKMSGIELEGRNKLC